MKTYIRVCILHKTGIIGGIGLGTIATAGHRKGDGAITTGDVIGDYNVQPVTDVVDTTALQLRATEVEEQ